MPKRSSARPASRDSLSNSTPFATRTCWFTFQTTLGTKLKKPHPNSKPVRGHAYRSPIFQRYLNEQPPERAREIRAAEAAYVQSKRKTEFSPDEGAYNDPNDQDFLESLLGYEDRPAGSDDRVEVGDLTRRREW